MEKPEYINYLRKIRFKNKLKISFFLFVIMLGYFWAFVPIKNFSIESSYSDIFNLFIKFSAASVLSIFIAFPLFSTDPLATGKSKHTKFFKELYPTNLIRTKYDVTQGEADDLWFKIFNSWSIPSCKNNVCWETVLDRTYACRFIFYSIKLLKIALIISGAVIGLSYLSNWLFPGNFVFTNIFVLDFKGWFYFVVVLILFVFFAFNNRVPNGKQKRATGCWYKYKEIAEVEQSALKNEVFDKCETYEEAYSLIDEIYSE